MSLPFLPVMSLNWLGGRSEKRHQTTVSVASHFVRPWIPWYTSK
jgi:hypothetical protein